MGASRTTGKGAPVCNAPEEVCVTESNGSVVPGAGDDHNSVRSIVAGPVLHKPNRQPAPSPQHSDRQH